MKRLSEHHDDLFEDDSGLGGSNLTPPKVSRTFEPDSPEQNLPNSENLWFKSTPFTAFGLNTNERAPVELRILKEPEKHHRARYMTEGSRGAIKDRSGLGHPVIRLIGYNKSPVTVSCYIGQDKAPFTSPHLFYQASKITSKNSLKCIATKVDGTSVISFVLRPENGMEATIDCVGILKERNVDVEHKLQRLKGRKSDGGQVTGLTKKRSTKCRLVFKCDLPDSLEPVTAVSQPLLCTQPAGCPEICKKSLSRCHVSGGEELFIIGKNFLKDCKVVFSNDCWTQVVDPDKEHFHSSHIVCKVPRYDGPMTGCEVVCSVSVRSAGKTSELHPFTFFTPNSPSTLEPVLAGTANSIVDSLTDHFTNCCDEAQNKSSLDPLQLLFPNNQEANNFQNANASLLFPPSQVGMAGEDMFTQEPVRQQQTPLDIKMEFDPMRLFPEVSATGNSFNGQANNSCQSLNLISQMSESELLGIINPSTFDSV